LSYITYALAAYIFYQIAISFYHIIYPFFIAKPIANLLEFSGGKWAIVTGSTDGIGLAYAGVLATAGFNLILISRSKDKLETTKREIESAHRGVKVVLIVYDFSDASVEHYEQQIARAITGMDVGVLVNNVGYSYEYPELLHKVDGGLRRLADITVINTLPTTLLTAIVLPQMIERNKGVIINIGSAASYNQLSMWAVYSATKKYVSWFSSILRKEYANTGIVIQTVSPMLVATKMSQVRKTSLFTPGPIDFARSAMRTVAIVSETNGCWPHQIQGEVLRWIGPLIDPLLTKYSESLRKRAIGRRQQQRVGDSDERRRHAGKDH